MVLYSLGVLAVAMLLVPWHALINPGSPLIDSPDKALHFLEPHIPQELDRHGTARPVVARGNNVPG